MITITKVGQGCLKLGELHCKRKIVGCLGRFKVDCNTPKDMGTHRPPCFGALWKASSNGFW